MNEILNNNAYAEWLDKQNWDHFCTFTTKYPMTMKGARRSMERLGNFTKQFGDVKLFWVAEPFDTKTSYHTHALMKLDCSNNLDTEKIIRNSWQIVSKGKGGKEYNNTIIKPYEVGLGAHYYITKYISRKNADYDLFEAKLKY